jgi:hypothetical protein
MRFVEQAEMVIARRKGQIQRRLAQWGLPVIRRQRLEESETNPRHRKTA